MPNKNVGPQAHSDTNIPHNVEMIQHLLHLTHKRTIINVSRGKKSKYKKESSLNVGWVQKGAGVYSFVGEGLHGKM